jgi:UDP-N-acetylmuramate dehydrogenase
VGATPIQNVGAYGQEVADTIRAVTVLERAQRRVHELPADACGFGYRDSAFKRAPDPPRGPGRDVRAAPGGAPRSATASSPRRSAGARGRRWRRRARVLALRRRNRW